MHLVDGDLVVSPTDLTRFLACRHLSRLDLEVARGERRPPEEADEGLEALFRRGLRHERAYLGTLRERGLSIAEFDVEAYPPGREGLRAAEADTVAAMAAGADVIYQATVFDGTWQGHADFLLRRPDRPGAWGWSYDVADTKLARRARAAALLQMSCYAERLTGLQGVAPERLIVVTGDGRERPYRFDRCATYTRGVRERLLAFAADPPPTDPQPVRHCAQCRWRVRCRARWVAEDRLSLVARLRPRQAEILREAGIGTVAELAAAEPGDLAGWLGAVPADRLVSQAGLQLAERDGAGPRHRVLPPEPHRGLALLPPPSEGDVFFDIEGDPYVGDAGLEYLFGVVDHGRYTAFWATDPAAEQAAFEALVDHLMAAWRDDPDMHVYHYAPYEPTRLKALAGRYDTHVEEVDRLLRGQRLVDLYTVVKQGVQVGKESYSLKKLEDHYWGHGREGAGVGDAIGSVVAFERWLLAGGGPEHALLESIRAYNEEDCRSTRALRDWLEGLRREAGGDGVFGRPRHGDGAPSPAVRARAERTAAARSELVRNGRVHGTGGRVDGARNRVRGAGDRADGTGHRVPGAKEGSRDGARGGDAFGGEREREAVLLLAALVDWHRREALPEWSDHFRWRALGGDELVDDPVTLGGLGRAHEVGRVRRSVRWRVEFPPQRTALAVGDRGWCDPVTGEGAGTVAAVRPAEGWLVLERAAGREPPRLTALVPPGPVDTRVLADRLAELAGWVARHGVDSPLPDWRAGRDLLLRRPLAGGVPGARLVAPGESAADAVLRLAGADGAVTAAARGGGDGPSDGGVLAVQGPPGTGKTHVAARLILRALAAGNRVGVCAFSHAAVGGLVRAVADGARGRGLPLRAVQKADAGQGCGEPGVRRVTANDGAVTALIGGEADLIAGTAWLFADPALHGVLDLLVVDEAGQLSLANVLAISGSARRLVLLGDPQQLTQPVLGVHPPGAGASALEHVLEGGSTVPADRGILLDTTFRMHPRITRFVSDLSYDGRVRVAGGRERQRVESSGPLRGNGLRWVPVDGRPGGAVAALVAGVLADGYRVDHTGERHRLGAADVLVLTPRNEQVRLLRTLLEDVPGGAAVRVGTVDVMQGAQACVVLYDLTGRGDRDPGRGLGFLLDRRRFTVALSRASALVAVVADPSLLAAPVRTPEQLLAVDALCRYAARADQVEAPVPVPL